MSVKLFCANKILVRIVKQKMNMSVYKLCVNKNSNVPEFVCSVEQ